MKILWVSASPAVPSGYGTQTALWCGYLRKQGHEVAIAAMYGAPPGLELEWDGMRVFPPPVPGMVAGKLMPGHIRTFKPDVVILLADQWMFEPSTFAGVKLVSWVPVDCSPLSVKDMAFLLTGQASGSVIPVAMSSHGKTELDKAGFGPVEMIPHAIDTKLFAPAADRPLLRAAFGFAPDEFVVGLNMNNADPVRKAMPENMMAFANFHAKHPRSTLFVNTIDGMPKSLELEPLIRTLKIGDCVRVCDQYRMLTSGFTNMDMARWYQAVDVVSNATYGEGFGLPAVEAQACGTPVITTQGTTANQVTAPACWQVKAEPYWNPVHCAWWHRPSIREIGKALEQAFQVRGGPFKSGACRSFAQRFAVESVGPQWDDLLSRIAEGS